MATSSRVMIVDRSIDNQNVLSTMLGRGGIQALPVGDLNLAAAAADRLAPDLIVLDGDSDPTPDHSLSVRLSHFASRKDIPIVVLGTKMPRRQSIPDTYSVAKPYHYALLLRKIEELLEACTEGGRTR